MIEKHLKNPASVVFDPIPSYSGDWIFTVDNLRKNAKVEEGINLWDAFYQKTYQEPLEQIFKTKRILDFRVGMISTPNSSNVGRCLQYSKVDFFVELTNFLNQAIDNYGLSEQQRKERIMSLINNLRGTNESLNIAYSEALKEKCAKLKDLLEKEINSDYYEVAFQDYSPYKKFMSFTDYVKRVYKIASDFQVGMLRLGDFFERSIDFNELYKTFEPDKFCLLFAKIIYEFNLIREEESNILDNSYSYLFHYKFALDEAVRENKKYDPKILFTLKNGKKLRYSRWQYQDEFAELMQRHPEAKAFKLPELEDGNPEKYKDIGLIEKLTKLYSEETKVNWEFLPEGERIKKFEIINSKKRVKTIEHNKDELVNEVNMRISILENSGFIGRPVKGLDTFKGYYAFIYPNGKVILEKFWENEETLNPAVGTATYVMTIDNFIEMSKISRINLIEYIKTLPEIGIKRIFHTTINNWQRNLYNEINGTYRLEDAIDFINSLKTGEVLNDK